MGQSFSIGRRRFTCISPTLVGLDFSPTGEFDDRPSMIVENAPQKLDFLSVETKGEWTILKTDKVEVRSKDNDKAFSRTNLEIRWIESGMLQFWRPGDRDHQNLGGTLRSLDRFGPQHGVEGVHAADGSHPDQKGLEWLAWLQCETDPEYYKNSPAAPKNAGSGAYTNLAASGSHGGRLLERSFNNGYDCKEFSVGVLSKSGYFLLNDTDGAVFNEQGDVEERDRPGYQRWFFFAYGKDYKGGLQDYVDLCGQANLPTRNSFGLIFSRWPAWKEEESKALVKTFEDKGYPLSTLVLDMEWHKEGWGHWDWEPTFYSDPASFVEWIHGKDMELTLNDHPLYVRSDDSHFERYVEKAGVETLVYDVTYNDKQVKAAPIDICRAESSKAFLEVCHKDFMDIGLDFWWNDGTRGLMGATWGQLVGNRLFFQECERDGKRGMNMARYGGMGNHRYGLFFTGDTSVCWDILKLEVEFNIRAGGVGVSSVSHDMGGFCIAKSKLKKNAQGEEIIQPLLYKRWLQFGVFNPILRFHCAPSSGSRQPWDYETAEDQSCTRWLQVRNAMLPYIYTAARKHYDTGLPVTRGHFLENPAEDKAYRFDQFMFGDDILVAPVLDESNRREVYFPEGDWFEFQSSVSHHGGLTQIIDVPETEIPVYVKAGSVLPLLPNPSLKFSGDHYQDLQLDVYPGPESVSELYEDDGRSSGYKEDFVRSSLHQKPSAQGLTLEVKRVEGKSSSATRNITLVVASEHEPHDVVVNGQSVDLKVTSLDDGRYVLDLGEQSSEGFSVQLKTVNREA